MNTRIKRIVMAGGLSAVTLSSFLLFNGLLDETYSIDLENYLSKESSETFRHLRKISRCSSDYDADLFSVKGAKCVSNNFFGHHEKYNPFPKLTGDNGYWRLEMSYYDSLKYYELINEMKHSNSNVEHEKREYIHHNFLVTEQHHLEQDYMFGVSNKDIWAFQIKADSIGKFTILNRTYSYKYSRPLNKAGIYIYGSPYIKFLIDNDNKLYSSVFKGTSINRTSLPGFLVHKRSSEKRIEDELYKKIDQINLEKDYYLKFLFVPNYFPKVKEHIFH